LKGIQIDGMTGFTSNPKFREMEMIIVSVSMVFLMISLITRASKSKKVATLVQDTVPPPSRGLIPELMARTTPHVTPVPATLPGQYVVPAALTKTAGAVSNQHSRDLLKGQERLTHFPKSPNW
jgi:hypothetical protein